jgi:hypothetical protein
MAQPVRRRGKQDIFQHLEQSNFKVCEEIVSKNDDGKPMMAFIKCTTPLGQEVYIEVDNPSTLNKEATMAEIKSLNTMPEEIKRKHFKNAGSCVSGVVLECEHNICVLSRNIEKEHPEERNFVYLNPASNKKTMLGDNPNPIPIIKMSDIKDKDNIAQAIAWINESTIRMRKHSHMEGLRRFDLARKSLQDVYDELTKFAESIDDKLSDTISVLSGLEDRQKHILENGLDQDEEKMMRFLNQNAIRFNELIAEENRCIVAVNNCHNELEKVAVKIREINQYLDGKYQQTMEALETSKTEITRGSDLS